MKKETTFDIFLALGIIWVIVGLIIYSNSAVWSLGLIFLIVGLVGKFGDKKIKGKMKK